ncbi:MAG: hypothetical protein HQK81_10665 [Desulfovibrionaceae bacterium]|nr:hypothetical protein [Desulfovibrionaceae bacterium]MBF0514504.1 hypothetical protein [Desulfovibrionaceae bacterium]
MKSRILPLTSILLLLGLIACAMEPRLTSLSIVYLDAYVKRESPAVYVQPTKAPPAPLKALIIPFTVGQDIASAKSIGTQITEIFWQGWNKDQVFPTLLYDTSLDYKTPEQIMLIARDRGVDLVVNGNITHVLAGGTQGDSMVGLNLQILDVKTGSRIWHMAQAGRMEPGMQHDFIIAMTRNRMPTDPIYAIVSCLAADTGDIIKNWNYNLIDEKGHKRKMPKS